MAAIDKLVNMLQKENVAKGMNKQKLDEIAEKVIKGYKIDRESRAEWEERCEDAIKFAKQITEPKSFPWEGAANVVFPLLTVASMAFASRVYPEIIKDARIVKCVTFGEDRNNYKFDRAFRVSAHMSYQRLIKSDSWEPDTDKLLHMLPIIGTCFRKVYYDPINDISQSDLCSPQDIVVNYQAASLEDAYRVSHRYLLNKNDMIEKMRNGYFLKIDLDDLESSRNIENNWETNLDQKNINAPEEDENQPHEFIEQHTYADLDGDGYEEPWIIVVHVKTSKVVGIYPRFDPDDIKLDNEGQILRIKPITYFVDYHFLRSPDGGFYSLGYGHLLYPLNEAINSLINQLLDSGTLSNTKAGLIARALKLKGGSLDLKMGEFVPVDPGTTGRIADSVYEFQFNPPSPVLLQLLSLVINSAKEIASINDILTGEAKPQNSPAHSVMELSSQGMKLYNAIAKRMYRSLKKEFKLLYNLNYKHLSQEEYFIFQDQQVAIVKEDYNPYDLDIAPVADPQMSSEIKRSLQANAMMTLLQNPAVLPELKLNNVLREFFQALQVPEHKIDTFLYTNEEKIKAQKIKGPEPEQQKLQLESQKMQKDFEVKMAQVERANRELELKYLDLQKKYEIKDAETAEKQARMLADAHLKQTQSDTMAEKLAIERRKVDVMEEKAENEEKRINREK